MNTTIETRKLRLKQLSIALLMIVVGFTFFAAGMSQRRLAAIEKAMPTFITKDGFDVELLATFTANLATVKQDGTIVKISKGAARLFGYEPEELEGKPITTLMPPDSRPVHQAKFDAQMLDPQYGEPLDVPVCRGLRKDGSEFDLNIRVILSPSDEGIMMLAKLTHAATSGARK